ncbi:hypothetical protein E2C01_025161 [Portunus trituberculatus]|uniref:Uncharacterized protein n=1 Tax=Portunus trituberculatus TaxID=210409 RepID=A0A5B7ECI5_PORTR|nr:hypothetical protein [Portunus trituberculatus]
MVRVTNPKTQPGAVWVSHSLAMIKVVIKSLNTGKRSSEQDRPAQHSTAEAEAAAAANTGTRHKNSGNLDSNGHERTEKGNKI